MHETAGATPVVCPNCNHEVTGVYCSHCGEQPPGHHDLALSHFFHDAFHELFHLDSRLFQTIKNLLFYPGFLTAEYFAGRKARYIRPLRVYLIVFALNLFLYSLYRPVLIYDFNRVVQAETTGKLVAKLDVKAERMHITREELVDRLSHRWMNNVSILQLVYVLMLAGVLKLVFLDLHKYYVEHLVFALHYYSFHFLWSCFIWPVYYFVGTLDPFGRTLWVTAISYLVQSTYIFLALRRVFRQSNGVTTYRTVIVLLSGQIMFAIVVVISVIAAIIMVLL